MDERSLAADDAEHVPLLANGVVDCGVVVDVAAGERGHTRADFQEVQALWKNWRVPEEPGGVPFVLGGTDHGQQEHSHQTTSTDDRHGHGQPWSDNLPTYGLLPTACGQVTLNRRSRATA